MLQTIAWSRIRSMCSRVMMSQLPVQVTKMLPSASALSTVFTSKPSMAACRAQIGSISVTITRAPYERIERAQPLPTSP